MGPEREVRALKGILNIVDVWIFEKDWILGSSLAWA